MSRRDAAEPSGQGDGESGRYAMSATGDLQGIACAHHIGAADGEDAVVVGAWAEGGPQGRGDVRTRDRCDAVVCSSREQGGTILPESLGDLLEEPLMDGSTEDKVFQARVDEQLLSAPPGSEPRRGVPARGAEAGEQDDPLNVRAPCPGVEVIEAGQICGRYLVTDDKTLDAVEVRAEGADTKRRPFRGQEGSEMGADAARADKQDHAEGCIPSDAMPWLLRRQ